MSSSVTTTGAAKRGDSGSRSGEDGAEPNVKGAAPGNGSVGTSLPLSFRSFMRGVLGQEAVVCATTSAASAPVADRASYAVNRGTSPSTTSSPSLSSASEALPLLLPLPPKPLLATSPPLPDSFKPSSHPEPVRPAPASCMASISLARPSPQSGTLGAGLHSGLHSDGGISREPLPNEATLISSDRSRSTAGGSFNGSGGCCDGGASTAAAAPAADGGNSITTGRTGVSAAGDRTAARLPCIPEDSNGVKDCRPVQGTRYCRMEPSSGSSTMVPGRGVGLQAPAATRTRAA